MTSQKIAPSFPQLYDIAHECGTDKGHIGPSHGWSANNYTDIYQAYLGQNRLNIEALCEVGLGVPGPNWESHIADHQQLTLSVLWSKLKPGGYYFIEDLNDQRPGNSKHQKHAPISCESTREVFKEYLKDGTVNTQNNFSDTTFFEEASYIALHSFPCVQRPKDFIKETIRYLVGRGGKGLLRHEYRTGAPRMIVLIKR